MRHVEHLMMLNDWRKEQERDALVAMLGRAPTDNELGAALYHALRELEKERADPARLMIFLER